MEQTGSHEAERWREALEPLPGIRPRIPDYVRKAGDALAAALEARERELEDLREAVSFAAVHRWREAVEARERRIVELEARLKKMGDAIDPRCDCPDCMGGEA